MSRNKKAKEKNYRASTRTINSALDSLDSLSDYSRDSRAYHAQAKRRKRGKKIALGIVCVLAVVLIGAGTAFGLYINNIGKQLTYGDKTEEELGNINDALKTTYETSLNEPFYMMLIGSDKRETDDEMGQRSDTNIVVRIDPVNDVVTMVSIMRDTMIYLPDYGSVKFNAAYAYNGTAGAIEAAEDLLDIEIAHYAEVDFTKLAELIDAIGGVTVEVDEMIDDPNCDDFDGNHYVIYPGTQTLSGAEALTFARSRAYADGDYSRTSNQRKLVEAMIAQVLSMSITDIPGVIDKAAECITTDFTIQELVELAQKFADDAGVTFYSASLPSYTDMVDGISYVVLYEDETEELMELVEAGEDPSTLYESSSSSSSSADDTADDSSAKITNEELAITVL